MVRIGKIVATHGLKGKVILKHIADKTEWLKKDDVLFLELTRDSRIPYFVLEANAANDDEYHIQLDDVETMEQAKRLIGKHVYVNEDILTEAATDSPLLWIGFNIVDKNLGSLGEIEDVMQTSVQWIATINYNGKEVLLPLIDEMLIEVNTRNKYIRTDLPEGLIEVYTEGSNDED